MPCVVPTCLGRNGGPYVTMFSVPKESKERSEWQAAINAICGEIVLKVSHVVCERHFRSTEIIRHPPRDHMGNIETKKAHRAKLVKGAVPSIFDKPSGVQSETMDFKQVSEEPPEVIAPKPPEAIFLEAKPLLTIVRENTALSETDPLTETEIKQEEEIIKDEIVVEETTGLDEPQEVPEDYPEYKDIKPISTRGSGSPPADSNQKDIIKKEDNIKKENDVLSDVGLFIARMKAKLAKSLDAEQSTQTENPEPIQEISPTNRGASRIEPPTIRILNNEMLCKKMLLKKAYYMDKLQAVKDINKQQKKENKVTVNKKIPLKQRTFKKRPRKKEPLDSSEKRQLTSTKKVIIGNSTKEPLERSEKLQSKSLGKVVLRSPGNILLTVDKGRLTSPKTEPMGSSGQSMTSEERLSGISGKEASRSLENGQSKSSHEGPLGSLDKKPLRTYEKGPLRSPKKEPFGSSEKKMLGHSDKESLRGLQNEHSTSSEKHLLRTPENRQSTSLRNRPLGSLEKEPLKGLENGQSTSSHKEPLVGAEKELSSSEKGSLRTAEKGPLRTPKQEPLRSSEREQPLDSGNAEKEFVNQEKEQILECPGNSVNIRPTVVENLNMDQTELRNTKDGTESENNSDEEKITIKLANFPSQLQSINNRILLKRNPNEKTATNRNRMERNENIDDKEELEDKLHEEYLIKTKKLKLMSDEDLVPMCFNRSNCVQWVRPHGNKQFKCKKIGNRVEGSTKIEKITSVEKPDTLNNNEKAVKEVKTEMKEPEKERCTSGNNLEVKKKIQLDVLARSDNVHFILKKILRKTEDKSTNTETELKINSERTIESYESEIQMLRKQLCMLIKKNIELQNALKTCK